MIAEVDVREIIPYENNPRKNERAVEYVANSIREFGFKVPVVLDRNNVIVTGHTRYEAAKKLGLEKIPAIYADDLTDVTSAIDKEHRVISLSIVRITL